MIEIKPNGPITIKQAVARAVASAVLKAPGSGYLVCAQGIELSAGRYKVNPHDFDCPTAYPGPGGLSLEGFTIKGEAKGAVELIMNDNTGQPLFNDENLASVVSLENLIITGTTGNEHAFRFASTNGRVSNIHLKACRFQNLAMGIELTGTDDTSETYFEDLSWWLNGLGQVGIQMSNPQSVNHWWQQKMTVEGFGTWLNVMGGGMIKASVEATLSAGCLIKIGPPSSQLGQDNDGYFFEVKPELTGTAQLLNDSVGVTVRFSKSNFNPTQGVLGRIITPVADKMTLFDLASCVGVNA